MSKQKVIVRDQGLTVTAAAHRYGVGRRWVHELLRREAEGGLDAVEPRPKRPLSNPHRTTDTTTNRILSLRRELATAGLDAPPRSPGTSNAKDCARPRPPPSAGSCTPPA